MPLYKMITIESLPIELLVEISSYLECTDLKNFSLTNKHIRSSSARHLFHTVALRLDQFVDLAKAIESYRAASQQTKWLKTVQHLMVMATEYESVIEVMDVYKKGDATPYPDDHGSRPAEPWKYCRPKSEVKYTATEWQALADFIVADLSALKDFSWACREQLPVCILRAIEAKTPRCRLRMRNFRLPSLNRATITDAIEDLKLDDQDMAIVTSPCLHAVSIMTVHSQQIVSTFPVISLLHQMVAGASPNLKELSHSWREEPRNYGLIGRSFAQGFALRILFPDPSLPTGFSTYARDRRGALTSLALEGGVAPDQDHPLSIWAKYTDFSAMQSLKLYTGNSADLFSHYDRCGQKLTSLRSLSYSAFDCRSLYNSTFFILTLAPLEEVELHDWNDLDLQGICLNKILRHCESTLQRLYCPDIVVGKDDQRKLRKICPELEVMEFQSDKVRPYRITSAMPSHLTRTSSPPNERLWPGLS